MTLAPQEKRALDYLMTGKALTVRTAMQDLGIGCWTKTCSKLRRKGFNITGCWIEGRNRYGEPTRYIEYRLKQEEKK